MKTVFLMLVLIFILAITTIVSAQTSESNQLRELLTDSACPRACFFDIQTGVTTQQQVQNILAGLNITYEVYAGQSNNDEPNGTYNWIPPTSTPFTTGGQVILHFSNGIARQMLISMNVSVTTVLETFGNPVTMAETDDTYFLEYADLGLVFTVSSRTDPTKVNQAILTADPAINNRFRDGTYGTSPVNQPCSTYGTPPCIAPTAVPATATRTPTPTVTQTPTPAALSYRINTGGAQVTTSGVTWNADNFNSGGKANTYTAAINGTVDDVIYQTERSTISAGGSFSYAFPVSAGTYNVRLHFAENWFTQTSGSRQAGVGKRVFDVQIEGATVLDNYDITASVGFLTADIKVLTNIAVTDGSLNINFPSASADNPTIAGIEIFSGSPAATATATRTPTATLTRTPTPTPTPTALPSTTVYRIDCGGSGGTFSGVSWAADAYFTGGVVSNLPNPIANTTDDGLYTTQRSTSADNLGFSYALPVTNGTYTVRLHFAELYWVGGANRGTPGVGKRVFNVQLEGTTVLTNYDITAQVGALAADIRTFTVTVTDGTLNINFPTASVNRPTLAALEVIGQ